MKVSVNAPKTPVTKGSNGMATATVPNVCKMPGPPAPFVPTPLPNIGKSGDSPKGYTKKVTVEGKTVAIKGATFNSVGDAASKATGGGLLSANTHGPTKFAGPGSMNVKFEGKNVQLLGDPMLNNCGPSGSPPNSATLLGVIQGPLLVVVEGSEICPVCEKSPHGSLVESDSTKAEAVSLESALKGAGFAARDISMLGVAHCRCGKAKSAARSTMQRSGDFSKTASGYLTPAYESYGSSTAVLEKIKAATQNKSAFDERIALANQRRTNFVKRQKEAPGRDPQVNVPGSCAAPRALLLLLEDGGLPGTLTERWCGSGTMANPVAHFDDSGDERRHVIDRVFEYGDTVPPCLACDAILPLLLCDKDKSCHT
ncbi:PAAR-like domain-containing protein [Nannocystis pusilla]|uniref:PAAR-like domain-containing protein n=1 Tax=Nannocystis pusilla TaxID=889268 RepID=UPI003DA603CC